MKERHGFQIYDGRRASSSGSSAPQGTLRMGFPPTPGGMTGSAKDALSKSWASMEHRLSALLEDREQLGRDLHDSVLQSLYAIGLSLETSRRIHHIHHPESERTYRHAVGQLNRLIQEIRGMIKRTADGTIPDIDFQKEVQALVRNYEQIGGLTIALDLQSSALDLLTREEEQEILSIVRESLSNCVRHAHATQADVTVRMRDHRIRVSIRDNGRGMAADNATPKGYGLANMEMRARKLGGSLQLQSKPGRGTRVTAEFPLEPILTPV